VPPFTGSTRPPAKGVNHLVTALLGGWPVLVAAASAVGGYRLIRRATA
jgi:hypothetical protein